MLPYSTTSRLIHNKAACEDDGGALRVTTPIQQWAYAVEFPPQDDAAILKTEMALNLRARVYEGEIGLGLLTQNGKFEFEVQIAASEDSEIVQIPLPKGTAIGSLMVRNTWAGGGSRADIEIVGCEVAPASDQPYWAASRFTHRQAVCKRVGDALRVTTPIEHWAYAVEFPPRRDAPIPKTDMTLNLRAIVSEGEIGLGLLTPDRLYNYEIRVAANDEGELVGIPLPKGTTVGSLMVRNTSVEGRSRADIEILGCEIASRPEEIAVDPAIFAPFKPWSGSVPSGFFTDWTGILTRVDVWHFGPEALAVYNRDRYENSTVPLDEEHVLDWAPLAQAVKDSSGSFRMAALGAGWGRWLAAGAALAMQTGRHYRLLGVEAEPRHFDWMLRHFKENKIPEDHYIALNAAATGTPGDCWFAVGDSQAWYGQSVYSEDKSIYSEDKPLPENTKLERTKGVTIDEILSLLSPLDYLHLDIQGAEFAVLSYRPELIDQKVRMVNIGTHSHEIEAALRKLFRRLGWECIYDIPLGSKYPVRLGDRVAPVVQFGDGIQVWRNQRLPLA